MMLWLITLSKIPQTTNFAYMEDCLIVYVSFLYLINLNVIAHRIKRKHDHDESTDIIKVGFFLLFYSLLRCYHQSWKLFLSVKQKLDVDLILQHCCVARTNLVEFDVCVWIRLWYEATTIWSRVYKPL